MSNRVSSTIRKIKPIYNIIHKVHQSQVDRKEKKTYIHADDIHIVYNDKKDKSIYMLFVYSGTQGLMAQMEGALAWIKYAEDHDYICVIDMTEGKNAYRKNEGDKENVWEYFFKQPYLTSGASYEEIQTIKKTKNYCICPLCDRASYLWVKGFEKYEKEYPPGIVHPSTRDYYQHPERQKDFEAVYNRRIIVQPDIQAYLDKEYQTVFGSLEGKILGVIIRGGDYVSTHPYHHPIQPEVSDVLEHSKQLISEKGYKYIYLATDDGIADELFKKEFGDIVMTNKRQYISVAEATGTPNGNIEHGIQYLSSMNLLSKCDGLIGGLCGGSQAAMLMNNGEYDYVHLFDLGDYGIDDV